ncbi:alpha-L-fucosidase [candidate division KSB1 bacterium]|nr:alpha-L-fucosidase [candidate division KSB1 bacterium]
MHNNRLYCLMITFLILLLSVSGFQCQKQDNMAWWREARFGLFIHWGLYAIPAGEWDGVTSYAEWIRTNAQIPVDEYDKFVDQFNPVNYDAEAWVRMAKDAGMKYITITSKHHDGFCLFDSEYTDYDVMSTPFKRDILKELADACHKAGIKICWYHSIMDWHHPDYLPRRSWETNRSSEDADLERYIAHMKNQLEELVTNYGDIGVLWFDGEWEETWTPELGWDLYHYLKKMDPDLIINNRVGKGRSGMAGLTKEGEYAGDFGTPEQEIPATGLPNLDWETCMTMNDHWGWNKIDKNWKSTEDLLRKLADIASKGGNFLLNVGPKPDGTFPQESIDRLAAIGDWMDVNGESIYGTKASPFKYLEWGRCTQKSVWSGTRLYLHVFNWPMDGKLVIPGIYNKADNAHLLGDPETALDVTRQEDALIISMPDAALDPINTVVVLDVKGKPDIGNRPDIHAEQNLFMDELTVEIKSDREDIQIRYTTDGMPVTAKSPVYTAPITLTSSVKVKARCFRDEKPVSGTAESFFEKVAPLKSIQARKVNPGIRYKYYHGNWDALPNFNKLKSEKSGVTKSITVSIREQVDYYGIVFEGFIRVPTTGMYRFYTESDDGSCLLIDGRHIVENDGIHGMEEQGGLIPLEAGFHNIRVEFFERNGGDDLIVSLKGPDMPKQTLTKDMLFH